MKTVTASIHEAANRIIKRAGIGTIYENGLVKWEYRGKVIDRPIVNRWEEVALREFDIEIKYTDDDRTRHPTD